MIRILLADDHNLVRTGVRHLLESYSEFEIVAEASNGMEAFDLYKTHSPDVTILDVSMPIMDGLEAGKSIIAFDKYAKILILTVYSEIDYASRFFKAGILGYITKTATPEELKAAVLSVYNGKLFISEQSKDSVLMQLVENNITSGPIDCLSDREIQVFYFLVNGKTVKEIASEMCLSSKTVENYRYRIFNKLGIRKTVNLVTFAYNNKLI